MNLIINFFIIDNLNQIIAIIYYFKNNSLKGIVNNNYVKINKDIFQKFFIINKH